jgi:hypothetical protein
VEAQLLGALGLCAERVGARPGGKVPGRDPDLERAAIHPSTLAFCLPSAEAVVRAFWVSHFHWDREWYRTFQAFRARLVDATDALLELCAADPGYRFLLDGQTVAVEDYLAVRPHRAAELRALIEAGRVAIGPWYVQPDSLLPAGESHVRNLLEGRHTGDAFGGASRIGYTPDSFGHPAQLPQILAGFGLRAFVFWRGHGDEQAVLPPEFDWQAPDGSAVLACQLRLGYFNAASDARSDADEVAAAVAKRAIELAALTRSGAILLLNGFDHAPPEARAADLAQRVAAATGFPVERALLEDFAAAIEDCPERRPAHRGELVGARAAPLLFGVWSTRSWIKLANRAAERELLAWAEPWAAFGALLGAPDERPALRSAWRELLANHAHDSICGCSRDEVHEQMRPRFDAARELARETARRSLERVAGQTPLRRGSWNDELELAVFNPSPHPRSDRVSFAIDPHPFMVPAARPQDVMHPAMLRGATEGSYESDGAPVRSVAASEPGRLCLVPDRALPRSRARGARRARVRLEARARAAHCAGADGRDRGGPARQRAGGDRGLERARRGAPRWRHRRRAGRSELCGAARGRRRGRPRRQLRLRSGRRERRPRGERSRNPRDPPGGHRATAHRAHPLGPRAACEDRRARSAERCEIQLDTEIVLAEGVPRVDVELRLENTASDHRLRLLFPLGAEVAAFAAATTFDVASAPGRAADAPQGRGAARSEAKPSEAWAPRRLGAARAHHVRAPGLGPRGRAHGGRARSARGGDRSRASGRRARAHARARGRLPLAARSRDAPDARRTGHVGAGRAVPRRAPCTARVVRGLDAASAQDAEWGLRAVEAGPAANALWSEGESLLSLAPRALLLSALKPAADGRGIVVRVLNPTPDPIDAELRFGLRVAGASFVRLDEAPADGAPARDGSVLRFPVGPHALQSLLVEFDGGLRRST